MAASGLLPVLAAAAAPGLRAAGRVAQVAAPCGRGRNGSAAWWQKASGGRRIWQTRDFAATNSAKPRRGAARGRTALPVYAVEGSRFNALTRGRNKVLLRSTTAGSFRRQASPFHWDPFIEAQPHKPLLVRTEGTQHAPQPTRLQLGQQLRVHQHRKKGHLLVCLPGRPSWAPFTIGRRQQTTSR